MFDVTAILSLLPIALVILVIIWIISRTGSFSLQIKDWFTISKEPELKSKLDLLMSKIDELELQNKKLMEDNDSINNKLDYMVQRDTIKYDFKGMVFKVNKKFVSIFTNKAEELLLKKNTALNADNIRALDEYTIIKLIIEILRHNLTKKAMDDFDKNGFNKVGYNAEGEFDQKIFQKYLSTKSEEFTTDLTNVLQALEDNRPYTFDRLNATVLLDRLVILNPSDVESILEGVLNELDEDIKDVYKFIIVRYQSLMKIGEENEGQ